ncbi:MAG: zinc-ribbon domain-containing protein [Desulfobacterales bacterium]|nr:zinc-ribbon domain-containing protein [Desulfobacterales bacterium]
MKKVYVDDSNKAIIICPKCGFEQNIDVTKFKDTQKKLKGKCRCGDAYQFTIEYRKRPRKDVRLTGEYFIQGIREKGDIIVRELSMIGIRFECLNPHHILKDDTVKVKFKLDDPKRSDIRKQVKVVWVRDRIMGAYYIETKLYKKDLGIYLQT